MGIGKVIALDDLLDNARRRAIRLELSVMSGESNLTDRANIELQQFNEEVIYPLRLISAWNLMVNASDCAQGQKTNTG